MYLGNAVTGLVEGQGESSCGRVSVARGLGLGSALHEPEDGRDIILISRTKEVRLREVT